ncbi:D-alanyl-D-alanine carboxypeptidase [Streptomyces sp. NBC_01431]|uniref:D-alanyl-D-alanine carboxypeptidase n=1 Tax=Streptomyces sp. NBC_01431 TaxID=2903863 RepID=UPI002E32A827|nr:D-alanyl-D-alanine carboxypeptidase [Streptomyces sp. NBC_01431]
MDGEAVDEASANGPATTQPVAGTSGGTTVDDTSTAAPSGDEVVDSPSAHEPVPDSTADDSATHEPSTGTTVDHASTAAPSADKTVNGPSAHEPTAEATAAKGSSAEPAGDETRTDSSRSEQASQTPQASQTEQAQQAEQTHSPARTSSTSTPDADEASAGQDPSVVRARVAPREPDSASHEPSATSETNAPVTPARVAPREPDSASRKPGAASETTAPAPPASPTPPTANESSSERTSEFVALKPDLPPPPRPRPDDSPRPAAPPPASASAPASASGSGSDEPERTREFAAPPRVDSDRTMALTRPPAPEAAAPATATGSGGAAEPPPPLDLLAQLTNTPPKPETLGRTLTRRIKIWGTLAVLLAIVLVTVQALRPLPTPTLKLTGKSGYTADGGALSLPWPSEGQAVVDINGLGHMGSYGEMNPLPIGSVAKVMTTYLILRDHPLKSGDKGPSIPVDQKAQDDYTNGVKEKESVVEVKAGQQISELEALQAVMLPSANNVARLLARWDASTEEAFIKKMNDTAKELGMTKTTYTDASGLIESTVSTAEDQVKLAKRAMADPMFRQIAKLPSYTSTTTSGGGTVETARTQRNFNKLVPLYGVVGIKTGSTTKAGGNLLFAAEKTVGDSKQLIIGAVFGQHKPNIIETATAASKSLVLAAGKALRIETVVKKGEVVGRVEDGLGGSVPVVAAKDLTVPVWSGATVDIKLTDGGKELPHSAKAGTEVGTLTVGSGAGEAKVPVTLQSDLTEPSFGAKLTRIG